MFNLKKIGFVFFALIFILSCSKKQIEFSGKYLTYTNTQEGYEIDYPSEILKPVDGAPSEQVFISNDGEVRLSVSVSDIEESGPEFIFKTADTYEKKEAQKFTVSDKNMGRDGFILKGYSKDKMFYCQALSINEKFYTIRFEYNKKDYDTYRDILTHIVDSFELTSASLAQEKTEDAALKEAAAAGNKNSYDEGKLISFAFSFLSNVYWENNFNLLLKNSSPKLADFVHPEYGVRRFYNPGTTVRLFSAEENFGFDESTDFSTIPSANKFGGSIPFYEKMPKGGFCEESNDKDGVYCAIVQELPTAVDPASFESDEIKNLKIELPNDYKAILKILILDEGFIKKTFYFFDIEDKWFLFFVDDCDCSA
ncbi:hypothetical protein E4O04_13400 [Treponema sp. OMZ 799]|uniref:hypothetical protein n=1 Tax=Treponema sp. OMZ 799 TaxID=2563668 RepID=UPI0020A5D0A0|nr:hypothetical protein [Treponema sp. OMZ 799]UTC78940.1 hypothetical protein E4O04_13400 [Treponema sp. OMZ 799]